MVSHSADAVIAGAVVVGCATAYALTVAGLRPLIIEGDSVASHASGFAFGELLPWWGPGIPDPLFPFARECMGLHQDLNPSLKEETGIDTRFDLRSSVSVAIDEAGAVALRDRCRWLGEQEEEARWLDRDEVHRVEPRISPEVFGALYVEGPPVNTYLGWDNCYATSKADGLLWSGSTEEDVGFDEQPTAEGQYSILRGLVGTLPAARDARVVNHTACLRSISADGLPIFGLVPGRENVYVATGTGRDGLLLPPGIGRALAELITQGTTSKPVTPFSLDRFNEQSGRVGL